MARAIGRLAAAPGGSAEAAVAGAMRRRPEMVAGEDRDVTALMRLVPGLLAKDGFEGVQLVGLPDGRGIAVKISDGGDRARMPVTVRILSALGVDTSALAHLAAAKVLGGGQPVGLLQATEFITSPGTSDSSTAL
jgi:L-asparaginase II